MKLLEKNPKMICGFGGAGDGREGRSGGGWRDRDVQGEVRTAAGSPGRRLSGAASLRFRGGGASRPHSAPAAAAAASRSSPAGPSHQIGTDPVAAPPVAPRSHSRRAAPLLVASDPAAEATTRGGGKGGRKTEAAAAAEGKRKRRSRWGWSRRCQSLRSVPAVGPRQCPFLSPIVNITGRLSPWHTRNRTFSPTAPASGAHSLETSNGKQGLIGRCPPSLPCQHVRLRADRGLAAGGGRRNMRVGREETEDWTKVRGTRMQPRSQAALPPLPPSSRVGRGKELLQRLGLTGAAKAREVCSGQKYEGFLCSAEPLGGGRLQLEDSEGKGRVIPGPRFRPFQPRDWPFWARVVHSRREPAPLLV